MSIPEEALTAGRFLSELAGRRSDEELDRYQRYFKFDKTQQAADDYFIGVRMGQVFELAKVFVDMPVEEIEKLLESPIHEARAGALSIMGKSAAGKKASAERLKDLYDLYIRRHDRINNWDLVDLAAHHVVGRYLEDKPRKVLYKLAGSANPWERRTAIVSTAHFIRRSEVADTFKIAERLLADEHELVHKATGWMLRAAGDVDRQELVSFLDRHAARMPRAMLRAAIEKLDDPQRSHFIKLR